MSQDESSKSTGLLPEGTYALTIEAVPEEADLAGAAAAPAGEVATAEPIPSGRAQRQHDSPSGKICSSASVKL